jgi:hypothetical protein
MKQNFTVTDCIKKLPRLVPYWSSVRSLINVRSKGWPDGPVDHRYGQAVIVDHYQPGSEHFDTFTSLGQLKEWVFDVAVSANVLNTFENVEQDGLSELARIPFRFLLIQIDEGNRSGIASGSTSDGTYQRNQPVEAYARLIQQNFYRYDVTLYREHNCIVIAKGRKFYQLDDMEV